MNKRILSLIIAIVIVMTSVVNLCADTVKKAEIKVDTTSLQGISAEIGDEISIPVIISSNPGFSSYAISLKIDENVFEKCDPTFTAGKVIPKNGSFLSGNRAQVVSIYNNNDDGEIFSIHLKVKKPVKETKIEVYLDPDQCVCDSDEEDVIISFVPGTVTFANAIDSVPEEQQGTQEGNTSTDVKDETPENNSGSQETQPEEIITIEKDESPDEKENVEAVQETEIVFADVSKDAYYYEPVIWAAKNNITSGVDENHFAPEKMTTRAQMVTFLWRAAGSPVTDNKISFTDTAENAYYTDAVRWAVANNITTGTSETTFSPDKSVTRAQAVTFLYRYFKAITEVASGENGEFNDVSDSAYYAEAVRWAVGNEVTKGTSSTTFSPDNLCTRGQIVTFLYRSFVK